MIDPISKDEQTLDELDKLIVEGHDKFLLEKEAALRIPEEMRYSVLNHYLTENGEGEPLEYEEYLAKD